MDVHAPELDWLVSVDDHVIEPANVWVDRVPAKYGDVAPQLVESLIKESQYVSQVVVVGAGRKQPAALIVPDWEAERDTPRAPLTPEFGMRVQVSAPPDEVVVMAVQPGFGGVDDRHDALLDCNSITRSRSDGVSARDTTVRASMIAPSTTARSALGPAAASVNAGW